jgi:hypothetical protein
MVKETRTYLFVDPGLVDSRLYSTVEAIVNGLGADVKTVTTQLRQGAVPPEVSAHKSEGPLFIIITEDAPPAWMSHPEAEDMLSNKLVIVCVRRSAPAHEVWTGHFDHVVEMINGENVSKFVASFLRTLEKAKETLLTSPESYTPIYRKTAESQEPYEVMSALKKVQVSPFGYGNIEFEWEIRILGSGFQGTTHYFGLNEHVPPSEKVPSLAELLREEAPNGNPTFRCAMLASSQEPLAINPIELTEQSTSRYCAIRFVFTPAPLQGTVIRFAWSWSHPSVFSRHGEDSSCFHCLRDFKRLDLIYRFERLRMDECVRFAPQGEPVARIINSAGVFQAQFPGSGQEHLNFVQYRWRFQEARTNSRFIIKWNLASRSPGVLNAC